MKDFFRMFRLRKQNIGINIKKNTLALSFSLVLLLGLILIASSSAIAQPADSDLDLNDSQLKELEEELSNNPYYSSFQKSMILEEANNMINSGISAKDTEDLVRIQVENEVNPYSMKKIFDTITESQQKGLPTETLINKFKEGMAKKVDINRIYEVLKDKSFSMEEVNTMLTEIAPTVLVIDSQQDISSCPEEQAEILETLANSLGNGVSSEYLSYLIKQGNEQGKSLTEITQVSSELGVLTLQASEMGLSLEETNQLLADASNNIQEIDQICANMQGLLQEKSELLLAQNQDKASGKGKQDEDSSVSSETGDSGVVLSPPDSPEPDEPSLPDAGISPTGNGTEPESPSDGDDDQHQPPEN